MKQKYFIDTNKGVTGLFLLLLIAIYHQWNNPTAWVYLALHGTYGLLWVLKSNIFPDLAWEKKVSLGFGLVSWLSLCLYWVAPWILTSQAVQAPGWYLWFCISLYALGVFCHFAADMQKHTALQLRPNHLITDGMFARLRNPNYFGELLIYAGFGLLAMHWLPVVILSVWVVAYWLPRMRTKDRVLSQYPDFPEYRARTKLFIPFVF
jgi:protein-S-isoprenylcysteine O-methyltransferase Ste14